MANPTQLGSQIEEKKAPLIPLFCNSGNTAVAYCRWGKGRVVILASAWSLCNQGIRHDDNLVLVLNALNYRDSSRKLPVIFDEFHHGYGKAPGITSLLDKPARLGLAQLGFAFLLLVFAVSRRFGRPIPLREDARQRNEYLTSMASLLRRAHAVDAIRSELRRRFMEDTARTLGLRPNADMNAIMEAASARRPDKVEALRKLLSDSWKPSSGVGEESELLSLAVRWHQLRKDLMNTK